MARKDNRPTVFSTTSGDKRKKAKKLAPGPRSLPPAEQTIYLHRESKHRGGKVVTLVKGLQLSAKDMKALAKELKRAVGTGGTIKNGVIEIQGEHREKLAGVLAMKGYQTKIAGG